MCWRRSATLTAGCSWPVWYGELFLRQWRCGEPPSKLLDSLTELRCSSGDMKYKYTSDTMHSVTQTWSLCYWGKVDWESVRGWGGVCVCVWGGGGGGSGWRTTVSASAETWRLTDTEEYSNRQEACRSLVCWEHLVVWHNRLDTSLQVNMAEGQGGGSFISPDTSLKSTRMLRAAVLLRALQPWASMKEWAIRSSCWSVLCSVMLQSKELSFRPFSCL